MTGQTSGVTAYKTYLSTPEAEQLFWYGSGCVNSVRVDWAQGGAACTAANVLKYASTLVIDASKSNAVYSASTTVQPNAAVVQYLIKY